jgi:hypothetical protein
MMRMRSVPLKTSLALALIACACASTGEVSAAPASATQAAAEGEKKDPAKEAEQKQDDLRKKKHELECAAITLDIGRLDAQADEISTRRAVEDAERSLELAGRELVNFQKVVRELEASERALDLDRASQNVREAEQELAELEAMYANEQFAGTTKELVLTRGRTRLELSKRAHDHAKRRAEQMKSFEHPKREQDLALAVDKAEKALLDAKAKEQRAAVQRKLDLFKAEHAVEEAQRAVSKVEGELAAASGKPAAAP